MNDGPGILDRVAQLVIAARGNALSGAAMLVFAALLVHADSGDGVARPSVGRLAELTGIDRRTVQRALEALVRVGALAPETVSREASRGRGRIVCYVVSPHAIRGDAAAFCRRGQPGKAAAMPPINLEKGGSDAAYADGKGGNSDQKRRQPVPEKAAQLPHEHSLNTVRTLPPNPPEGAGNRSARPEALQPETDEVDPARQRSRLEMFQTIQRLGRIEREFVVRGVVHDFEASGGTLADLSVLIAESDDGQRSRRDRIGLVTHWASDVGLWRAVLADVQHRARAEAQPIRQASITTSPASAIELLRLPARAQR